ncbi:MAG: two-component regulator propeller domain-containing protein [Fodinibius sp.]|nr:two-component regulator propeller domain-containing protein [Fodinibius sp.]
MVGTRWGLSIYDGNSFNNFDETELPYRKIRSLLSPTHSSGFWLGTDGEGLLRYQDGQFKQYLEEDGLANNTVMSLAETEDGAIWAATYGGVSRYQDGSFTNYSIEDGLPNNGVLDILKDNSGTLWFATYGGIARFSDGSLRP